mgnify:CR=1 FL=1
MLSGSTRFRHISISKYPYVDFDDFEAFLNRARSFFARTAAQKCSPIPRVCMCVRMHVRAYACACACAYACMCARTCVCVCVCVRACVRTCAHEFVASFSRCSCMLAICSVAIMAQVSDVQLKYETSPVSGINQSLCSLQAL